MSKKRLLLFDPEPTVTETIMMTLKDQYSFLVAHTPKEAIVMAQEIPDAIIMETILPNQNGCDVIDILKTEKNTQHIPIMILSSRSIVADRFKSCFHGSDDYMVKPFDSQDFIYRVKRLVGEAGEEQ